MKRWSQGRSKAWGWVRVRVRVRRDLCDRSSGFHADAMGLKPGVVKEIIKRGAEVFREESEIIQRGFTMHRRSVRRDARYNEMVELGSSGGARDSRKVRVRVRVRVSRHALEQLG